MKILICFGTRPEAIKMAPICLALSQKNIPYKLCVTAQHREMLDQVLEFFGLVPDYDLNIMQPNQNLNVLSARILADMDAIFKTECFDLVLVHGDTTTSAMVALAAFHRQIKVAHVEAGLRTYNKLSPFPEELNRQFTGRIADFHFAPTEKAKDNLLKEHVDKSKVLVTGNTVVDALFITLEKIKNGFSNNAIENLKERIGFSKRIILVTGHRRESFGVGFENLCKALLEISKRQDVDIIYPVHLNPNVQDVVYNKLSNIANIHLIKPLDYPSFVWLMSKSTLIISDSGGVQEEAPSLRIPVLVTRETTERNEGINAGCSILVGTNPSKINAAVNEFLKKEKFQCEINPYGNGDAANKIVDFLQTYIK
ncbi:UDP-N-acetylglucosamine 2-epimerase (non-hydrolyzing) [Tamlana fucoidanivorans]|uniref:UDP-N-acetylglucosamine 2-epimerase (non-hydrolyzing) n=1 Tax=Allotamlana fucoidanivorans TaxID=2583814 RepID=A0A5C4SPW0_9FLAO|nr:UDP-N-acetylglucosamine 2-epimerase (non-hydrolyzing) [Tamlana fucoidanivorans]TNJ45762.1 UDP-N-acetylglucosamine 2-epimerase (non-hydrolyzing) [Tamlana fucoidanivorans]